MKTRKRSFYTVEQLTQHTPFTIRDLMYQNCPLVIDGRVWYYSYTNNGEFKAWHQGVVLTFLFDQVKGFVHTPKLVANLRYKALIWVADYGDAMDREWIKYIVYELPRLQLGTIEEKRNG